MIRSEAEHQAAVRDLRTSEALLERELQHWREQGFSEEEALAMTEPLRLQVAELEDEIDQFERIRAGDLSMFTGFQDLGKALIAARIARRLSQRELAERVGVHESQVSRDERNEYHGIGTERVEQVLEALELHFEVRYRLGEGTQERVASQR